MDGFGKFLATNGLKKKEIASYLEVSPAFVTQLCAGSRQIPADKLAKIKANKAWDTSMFGIVSPHLAQGAVAPIVKVVGDVKRPETSQDAVYRLLVEDYKRQIKDKDALVQELCKKIGMLEAQIEVLTKGGIPYVAITTPEDAK
jgi:DNA-binding transcriptional regulator YdaS (Cro superfamily)